MSEKVNIEFSEEQLLKHAQGNLQAIALSLITFLKEKGHTIHNFTEYVSVKVAPGWSQLETALEIAHAQAINFASFGVEVLSLSGDEDNAKIEMKMWPEEAALAFYGVTEEQALSFWEGLKFIANHIGFDYHSKIKDDKFIVKYSRKTED